MRNLKISLCYHPTTIPLVDDNKDYLDHLLINLNEVRPCLASSNPLDTLNYFVKTYRHLPFSRNCIQELEENKPKHLTSVVDINKIQDELFRKDRFSEVATAIIDYGMPPLNGIELSKKLKEFGVLTILLTGEAENELAISALNKGEIDFFIKKTEPNLKELLLQTIYEMEKRYFLKLSASLLSKMPQHILACLSNLEVAEVFDSLCQENKTVEFYLLNEMGSFLMIDTSGQPAYFILASEKEMEAYYQTARIEEAPEAVLNALKNRTKIPFFHTEQDLVDVSPTEWEQYLQPASEIEGEQTYYYAFIKDVERFPLPSKPIVTYQEYLKNV